MTSKKKLNVAVLTSYLKDYVKYDFYFPSEKLLKDIFSENDIEIHYVSPFYYDQEKKHFTEHVATLEDNQKVIKEPYQPDVLRVKMSQTLFHLDEMFQDAPFITAPSMRLKHIESDKYQIYKFLPEYQPKTTLLTTYYFYPWLQDEFHDRLVVKPIMGSGGYGIEFYSKPELSSMEVFQRYAGTEALHLVQDYKNFSDGIPGIVDGNHDLRIVFLGNKPTFSIIRVPKAGSLKSNIAGGGRQFSLPIEAIPEEVMISCSDIQKQVKIQDNDVYSLDFGYCAEEDKWYLIEINSAPGIWFPDEDKQYQYDFFQDLADHFQELHASHA